MSALRFVLRLPFIPLFAVPVPLLFVMAFALGDSPREAWDFASAPLRAMLTGRLA